jgi:O-antigen/teichoic acid export membrane protein
MRLASLKQRILGHKNILQSIGAVAGGNFLGAILGAVGGLLVARFIPPEVNGQFRVFTIPLMYLTFLHLGTFDGLQRQIPFFVGRGQKDHAEKLASTAGAWNLGMTIVVACGFTLYALYSLWQGNHQDAVGWFTQAVCCLTYYTLYLSATYRTLNHFVILARIHLIQAVTLFLLVSAVAVWGFYGMCLRYVIPTVFGVWLLASFPADTRTAEI